MATFDFDWVDAFSDQPFRGNGCAVVHGGAGLNDDTCKAFVRETSLVECTFTGPSELADIRVRYFLASREIPFAGHPTVATVAAMRARGLITSDTCVLETGAGLIQIDIDGDLVEMTQVAPEFGATPDPARVANAIGLLPDAILGQPQLVSTGLPFCITVLRDKGDLRAARLNVDGLRSLAAEFGHSDTDIMEPFLVTLGGETAQGDTFSRLLLASPGPKEDPFTGSATGAMAAYLWHHGLMQKDMFIAEQGHWMNRPGQARVRRVGPADALTGIKVAGQGYVLMSGQMELPETHV